MNKVLLLSLIIAFHMPIIGAQNFWKNAIKGEGPVVKKEISLPEFEGIRNGFSCDVIITQGSSQKIVLEGQENILDNLELDVAGNILKIKYDRMVKKAEPVKIYITMTNLVEAVLSGSGSLSTTNHFSGNKDLHIAVSGSGDVSLDIDANDIDMKISGSGDIYLKGSGDDLDMTISGSGGIDSRDLSANNCKVSISGSGNATVNVRQDLDARVSGSGNVRYRGDVARINSRVSGSGSIHSLN